ncbi:MAG: hypothetical protein JO356_20085 [Acidobacteria bacterium]|nr:hypothetical protein [Acidobacteriota bacterium]
MARSQSAGRQAFRFRIFGTGESFSHSLSVPGVYRYSCVIHEAKVMSGEIVVRKWPLSRSG